MNLGDEFAVRTTRCQHCGQRWTLLPDGTIIEHPLPDTPYLLCSGSRTKAVHAEQGEALASTVPRRRARSVAARGRKAAPRSAG